jgi:hypothetical protein
MPIYRMDYDYTRCAALNVIAPLDAIGRCNACPIQSHNHLRFGDSREWAPPAAVHPLVACLKTSLDHPPIKKIKVQHEG